jgi:hypothetical protein
MIDKIFPDAQAAIAVVHDGATVMIGRFGGAGRICTDLAVVEVIPRGYASSRSRTD